MNQSALQAIVDKHIQEDNIFNIVIGIQSKDGTVDACAAAGTAHPETGAPMQADTPYLIASVSKMVTAAAILQLHQEGLLSLDDPIANYLPAALIEGIHVMNGRDASARIKVFQLVNQTSGLADYFEDKPKGGQSLLEKLQQGQDQAVDIQGVVEIVRTLEPKSEPGANKAHYADTNYQLLGAIIEAVTGQSIAENFQARIFDPLGLAHTYPYSAIAGRTDTPAAAYFNDQPLHIPLFFSKHTPDGGLVSTVPEGLIFLRAFFEGKLFDTKWFKRMMTWNSLMFPLQYGYGMMRFKMPWFFSPFKSIPELIGHSGSTGAFAYYCPAKAVYLVGTVNQLTVPRKPIQLMIEIINGLKTKQVKV